MHKRRLAEAILLGAVFTLGGCGHAPVPEGCGSDKDCKLDRVCEANHCVWPQKPTGAQDAGRPVAWTSANVEAVPAGPPAQGMFRFDPRHRGRSPFLLPKQKPEIVWMVETPAPVTSSPTVSNEGLVLVGGHGGKLLASTGDGKPAWSFTAADMIWSTPAIAADGTVYVGSDDDNLYALEGKTGKMLWKLRVGA